MEIRTSNILSLAELQQRFAERLKDIFNRTYAPLLEQGILTQSDADNECGRYIHKYRSSLQQVYSRYAEQWDAFHTFGELPDDHVRDYLSRASGAFRTGYDQFEFNIAYYRKEFQRLSPASATWKQVRKDFTFRWHQVLSDREYNYQLQHIERLCNDFYRMQQERCEDVITRSRNDGGLAQKLTWLQLQSDPLLRKQLEKLMEIIRRNPIVNELQKRLGRSAPSSDKQYRAQRNREARNLIRHNRNGTIRGVSEGNDLNRLLPTEYTGLADQVLYGRFLRRYTSRKLQMYEVEDRQAERISSSGRPGKDLSAPAVEGPFVVCLDTSASMKSNYELVAKAILLAMGFLSERTRRRCKVILFSEETVSCEFESLSGMLDRLSDFFCQSFHSGTDLTLALQDTLNTLEQPEYSAADVLLLSDFETDPLPPHYHTSLQRLKEAGTRLYTVVFGNNGNDYYESIGTHTWYYR